MNEVDLVSEWMGLYNMARELAVACPGQGFEIRAANAYAHYLSQAALEGRLNER